jgi:ubiquitin-conjugating enzyme E2 D/E
MALKRISREYAQLMKEPMPSWASSLTVWPVYEDLFRWRVTLNGPEGSVYLGCVLALDVNFPIDYPFKPPKVRFVTKVFHPNISIEGGISMEILDDQWSPALHINAVLLSIFSMLLIDANPDAPVNPEAAVLFVRDRAKYDATARAWAQRYAHPDVAFMRLSFPDCLNGRRVSLALVPGGKLQSPKDLRAQIMRPLNIFKCHKWIFAHHRRQQALLPFGCVVAECSPCGRVRLMLPCVAFACQRLATAPAGVHVVYRTTRRWIRLIFERVMRGRVKKVQVRL